MTNEVVFEVPAMTRIQIRRMAHFIRDIQKRVTGADQPRFPIVEFIEFTMPETIDPDFIYDIRHIGDMGDNLALAMPDKHEIWIREDVWDGANRDKGRDRGVLAHEVGHYFLHPNVGLARRTSSKAIPSYRSSEWQAKAFQGELLVCSRHVCGLESPDELAETFGVSIDSAKYQLGIYSSEGLFNI